ncbi:ABC transporter ATP-binding protein [Roseovarius spongiae]|uniref:ABC transporter ATP-binding protein n=1 Tax=Roseovarius spongiae TaxID=2320272 RepID=A0A3A8B563_9RHOB|nr:ABC transporter ATP-binding protein [Roseovarius spongiae]RKF14149.1 ABC transporter ATP-binding protein [Roseovarius spongiae]
MTETTAKIRIDGLSKKYGGFTALEPTSLDIQRGEFLTLLGPSGSGKTTLLQMVSGLTPPTSGRLLIDGEDWTGWPVHDRDMGLVFQHYALFPHMTVAENVAFPLKMRKIGADEIRRRVAETLEKVQLDQFGHRFPRELSGGQQQRVALARCFVFRPEIILMDEPLGALDKALRETMQLEIRRLHREFGTTLIYVTHDQEEALVLSDRICVMNHARVEQVGTPHQIYSDPETIFAATFIGHSNLLRGRVEGREADGMARIATAAGTFRGRFGAREVNGSEHALIIRPEQLSLGPAGGEGMNELRASLRDIVYIGSDNRLLLGLPDGTEITVRQDPAHMNGLSAGDEVTVHWPADAGRIVS